MTKNDLIKILKTVPGDTEIRLRGHNGRYKVVSGMVRFGAMPAKCDRPVVEPDCVELLIDD